PHTEIASAANTLLATSRRGFVMMSSFRSAQVSEAREERSMAGTSTLVAMRREKGRAARRPRMVRAPARLIPGPWKHLGADIWKSAVRNVREATLETIRRPCWACALAAGSTLVQHQRRTRR